MDERLQVLIAEILDLPLAQVKPDTRRADTDAWDSLAHLRLITAIEAEFRCLFTMEEIANLQTCGELQRRIDTCDAQRLDA